MTVQDLGNNTTMAVGYRADNRAATPTAMTGVDTSGYSYALVIIDMGAVSGSTDTVTFAFQDNIVVTAGSFATMKKRVDGEVSTTDATVAIAQAGQSTTSTIAVDLNNTKDFIRVLSTHSGTTDNFDYSVQIVLMPDYTGNADAPTFSI